jgi:hypothetical protein
MGTFKRSLILFIACISYAKADFKADAPVYYKDKAKYSFGSLIKGKNSVLKKYLDKKSNDSNEEKDGIKVEKIEKKISKKEKLWNAAIEVLKDFPIEFMDKKHWKIETEKVKVNQFDNTGECSYKITVAILNDKDITITVTSDEDSKLRLKKHEETIRNKVLAKA